MIDLYPRVLVTGGAGFIGSHLAEELLAAGHEVAVLDDLSTGSLRNIQPLIGRPGFQFHLGSVLEAAVCDTLVSRADLVIHLAAAVGVKLIFERPAETIERNVMGTSRILDACLRHCRKVFVASTSEVYGKEPRVGGARFREDDDITLGASMRWAYAASKAIDEYLARAYAQSKGLPAVVGRLFNTVGPRQSSAYGMVLLRFVSWALEGKPIQVYGDGSQTRAFCHVRDVTRAVRLLIAEPRAEGEIFNIGSSETVTILELAQRVKEATLSASEIRLIPYEQAYGPGFDDIKNRVPDLGKIHALVGYEPRYSLDAILRDVIEFVSTLLSRSTKLESAAAVSPQ